MRRLNEPDTVPLAPIGKAMTKALVWLGGFGFLFFALWLFFSLTGKGMQWEFNGHVVSASPALQAALTTVIFPLLILAVLALFFAIFSFTWLSVGLIFLATALIIGLSFLPLMAPVLIPLAFFLLLLAIFTRQGQGKGD